MVVGAIHVRVKVENFGLPHCTRKRRRIGDVAHALLFGNALAGLKHPPQRCNQHRKQWQQQCQNLATDGARSTSRGESG